MPRRLVALLLVLASCPGPGRNGNPKGDQKPNEITLFLTTELKGTVEPCGCNSDPLGDLARTAALVAEARSSRPVALLDGGSTLYSLDPIPENRRQEEALKAQLLAEQLPKLGLAATGLGPFDLAAGPEGVRLPRQAANVTGPNVEPPKLVAVGGEQVGVFGVVDPVLVPGATDPAAAARLAIADLRGRGARVVVALAHMSRAKARKLAREAPGADLVLVGEGAPDRGLPTPEAVGTSWLVQPGNRGQVIARVDLHVEGGPLADAVGPARARERVAELTTEIATLEQKLAAWRTDTTADPTFLARREQELAAKRKERADLEAQPLRAPARGSWFTLELVPIRRRLACDPAVQEAKTALDGRVARANLDAARDEQPPPVPAGGAGYAGIEECGYCHKAAVEFWKTTRHEQAWETLEKLGKHLSRDCISCHVTGWQEPGGAVLAQNEPLRDVQCEVCHGPASTHVDANGKEKPSSLVRVPAEDRCARACHTPEHSDTFQLQAYLRDVTGKGHGEAFRKKLGDGPTGHELRSAALEKAGRELGQGCKK